MDEDMMGKLAGSAQRVYPRPVVARHVLARYIRLWGEETFASRRANGETMRWMRGALLGAVGADGRGLCS
eukprot:8926589-Lingulodinium_polyedra.AAC.1